jgi:hypothetical protein
MKGGLSPSLYQIHENSMSEIRTTYRSYVLRLWREDESGTGWRAMLVSVVEPERQHYFKDIESLTAYLMTFEDDELPKVK